MYPSLTGNFNISAPIQAISSTPSSDLSPVSSIPFPIMYLDDPWTLPSLSTSDEDAKPTKMRMSLSIVEVVYQATLEPAIDPSPPLHRQRRRISFYSLLGRLCRHAHMITPTIFFFFIWINSRGHEWSIITLGGDASSILLSLGSWMGWAWWI